VKRVYSRCGGVRDVDHVIASAVVGVDRRCAGAVRADDVIAVLLLMLIVALVVVVVSVGF
jgi:hypothetical protein